MTLNSILVSQIGVRFAQLRPRQFCNISPKHAFSPNYGRKITIQMIVTMIMIICVGFVGSLDFALRFVPFRF